MRPIFFILSFHFFSLLSSTTYGQSNSEDYLIRYTEPIKNKAGYKNRAGKVIIPAGDYIACLTDTFFNYAIVAIPVKGLVGIDRHETVLYKVLTVDNAPDKASEGLFRVIKNGKIGYADLHTGRIIIKPQYAYAKPFDKGIAQACLNCEKNSRGEHIPAQSDVWFSIHRTGEKIWNPDNTIVYIKRGYGAHGRNGSFSVEQVIDSTKIITTRYSDTHSPEASKSTPDTTYISQEDWGNFTNIDADVFFALPPKTGCGSCVDAGDHWLEIGTLTKNYKIVFDRSNFDDVVFYLFQVLPPFK